MTDYTLEELEQMLADKQAETLEGEQLSELDQFIDSVCASNDKETEIIKSNNIIVGFKIKSKIENKQYTEQRLYTTETENGNIVGRAVSGIQYTTGSYSDSLTNPTLHIIGTRVKDRKAPKGS